VDCKDQASSSIRSYSVLYESVFISSVLALLLVPPHHQLRYHYQIAEETAQGLAPKVFITSAMIVSVAKQSLRGLVLDHSFA
jgi:hypothetical protein